MQEIENNNLQNNKSYKQKKMHSATLLLWDVEESEIGDWV